MLPRAAMIRPNLAFIPSRYYETLLDVLEERGVDREAFLREAGIHSPLGEGRYLTIDEIEHLVLLACAHDSVDALGLTVGSRLQLMSHGALSVAALTSPTIDYACEIIIRFFPLINPLFTLVKIALPESVAVRLLVRWPLDPEAERFHTAAMMGSLYAQLRFLLGGEIPRGAILEALHPRPPGLPEWVDRTGVELRFGAKHYQLTLPSHFLEYGLPLADPRAHEDAVRGCEALLQSLPDPERLSVTVAQLLRSRGAPYPGLEETARALSLSSRSLRRRLDEEGSSFREILEDIRMEEADRLLGDDELTITEIAHRLAYSDSGNFSRAYRRARGMSPREARSSRGGGR